jgi:hypothetical protein
VLFSAAGPPLADGFSGMGILDSATFISFDDCTPSCELLYREAVSASTERRSPLDFSTGNGLSG